MLSLPADRSRSRLAQCLVASLVAIDVANAVVAARHDVRGEPLGIGRSLDPRRVWVSALWGTGLSAPLVPLLAVSVVGRRWPNVLAPAGAAMVFGALSEPGFWGRRALPLSARIGLLAHTGVAAALVAAAWPRSSYAKGAAGSESRLPDCGAIETAL